MKSLIISFFALFLLTPITAIADHATDSLDLCPAGARMSDYADTWRNGEWELRITAFGDVTITRYSDYHYRGQSDYPFRLQRDYSSPTDYSIEGRYTISGKDGTFRGRMTLNFCYEFTKDQLCGHYVTDNGQHFNWRAFTRY